MNARELLSVLTSAAVPDIDLQSVTEHASQATATSVFVCICGARADGHDYAAAAYQNGCRFFIAQKPITLPSDASIYKVDDTRNALSLLARRLYGDPSRSMHLIGITGTKGKTTTARMLAHILNRAQIPCGYIGTNGISYGEVFKATQNTTPDAVTLQKELCEMKQHGVHTAVIEVSSQAILQSRVAGMRFLTTVFTNLSPDHIGKNEHPNFENYRDCKHQLFTEYGAQNMICNADDTAAFEMKQNSSAPCPIMCSVQTAADYSAKSMHLLKDNGQALGIGFTLQREKECVLCRLPLLGTVNAQNALLAAAVANNVFGIPLDACANALSNVKIDGRSEMIPLSSGATVVIDYAHNGASLTALLSALREYQPKRLICLFGSVGERSQMRRHELGNVAASLCDLAIITSDNPGNEPPEKIINEIAKAFEGTPTPYIKNPDRTDAIRQALQSAQNGDILVLAGKGHETYQLIGSQKIPFSEREIVEDFMRTLPTLQMI